MTTNKISSAISTPLASIFGSGFLVVVPILASAVGPYSVLAMAVVAIVAFLVGGIVRHNILCAEPVLAEGSKRFTVIVERLPHKPMRQWVRWRRVKRPACIAVRHKLII